MRSFGWTLCITALLVPVAISATLPTHALASRSESRYRTLTVPQAIAMCQTIYRDVRLNVRVPGYYVPMVHHRGKGNSRAGWLYASHRTAASNTNPSRIWVIWNQQHSVAGQRIGRGDVAVRGVLNTRTCVLREQTVSSTTLRDAPPKYRSTLSLTIIQPLGHRPAFRSVGLPFRHGITIKYSYLCHNAPGHMTITVMPSTVAYRRHVPRRDVLATFRTNVALLAIGAYAYGKEGWFRIGVVIPQRCSWSMHLYR